MVGPPQISQKRSQFIARSVLSQQAILTNVIPHRVDLRERGFFLTGHLLLLIYYPEHRHHRACRRARDVRGCALPTAEALQIAQAIHQLDQQIHH